MRPHHHGLHVLSPAPSRTPIALLFAAPLLATGSPAAPPPPSEFRPIGQWAGPEAEALGFTHERVEAFLSARAADLAAGKAPPWSDWLKGLCRSSNPSLRAWALARRVEAGDLGAFLDFQEAAARSMIGHTRTGSGLGNLEASDPPNASGPALPRTFQVDPRSSFWRSLRKTLQSRQDREFDLPLYSVWCFGTAPDQRDLILDVAAHIRPAAGQPPSAWNPWKDPRLWIVRDWAVAWGRSADLAAIQESIPDKDAKELFSRTRRELEAIPGCLMERDAGTPKPSAPPSDPSGTAGAGRVRTDFSFSPIRVSHQPPTPAFPPEARAHRLGGFLVVDIQVGTDGRPLACRPLPGPLLGIFGPTGMAYAMRWQFHPARLNDTPVPCPFRLRMPFHVLR